MPCALICSQVARMNALKCLYATTSLPYNVLHPHRSAVLQGVGACLDDKKRLVRQEAVRCRNKWYAL